MSETDTTPFVDRRTAPRTRTRLPVQVSLRGLPGPLTGRAVDIGPSGICVATPSRLPIRDVASIAFSLDGGRIEVAAEGRWQRLDNTGRGFVAGLMFRDVEAGLARRLRRFVYESALETASFMLDASALAGLALDDAVDAALLTRSASYPVGQRIYGQGGLRTRGDSLFIVEKGTVVLEVRAPGTGPVVVSRIGEGGVFAGLPLLAETPHAETAIAETEVDLIEIEPFSFATLDQMRPRVGRRMIRAALQQRAAMSRTLDGRERRGERAR